MHMVRWAAIPLSLHREQKVGLPTLSLRIPLMARWEVLLLTQSSLFPAESILLLLGGGQRLAFLSGLCLCYGCGQHGGVSIHLWQLVGGQEMRCPIGSSLDHSSTSSPAATGYRARVRVSTMTLPTPPFSVLWPQKSGFPWGFLCLWQLQAAGLCKGQPGTQWIKRKWDTHHQVMSFLMFLAILPPSFHRASPFLITCWIIWNVDCI